MTKKIYSLIISLLVIAAAALIVVFANSCVPKTTAYEKYYDVEFNRGGRDARPENTLYSYSYAIEEGATTIEGDMQMTKDGVVVMSHNPILSADMTMDEHGNYIAPNSVDIRTLTFEEVQKYNVGHIKKTSPYYSEHGATQIEVDAKIPSLEQLLQLVKDSGNEEIMLNLETKLYPDPAIGQYYTNNVDAHAFGQAIMDLLKKYNMVERTIIQSFDWSIFPIVEKIDSRIKTSALWSETDGEDCGRGNLWVDVAETSPWLAGYNIHDCDENAVDIAFALGCDIISPELDQISTMQIEQAHEWGMKVIPWTVNKIEDMEKAWAMGCDGMITDKGWLLRDFLTLQDAVIPERFPFDSPYHLD